MQSLNQSPTHSSSIQSSPTDSQAPNTHPRPTRPYSHRQYTHKHPYLREDRGNKGKTYRPSFSLTTSEITSRSSWGNIPASVSTTTACSFACILRACSASTLALTAASEALASLFALPVPLLLVVFVEVALALREGKEGLSFSL
jgi:hypothetical protein